MATESPKDGEGPLGEGWLRLQGATANSSKRSMFSMVGGALGMKAKEKRCYFVLNQSGLTYYVSEKKSEKIGSIPASEMSNACPIMGVTNCFNVTTTEKVYRLVAETTEDMKNWVMALYEVIPLKHKKSGLAFNPSLQSLPSLSPLSSKATNLSSLSTFSGSMSTFSGSMRGSMCIQSWLSQKKSELGKDSSKRKNLRSKKGHIYSLLVPGGLFKKFNSRCRGQIRRVCCDKKLQKVSWSEPKEREKIKGELDIRDIVAINAGCTTARFPASATTEMQSQCFSIVTNDRTLDLQINEVSEKRNDWVDIFRSLALLRWLEDSSFDEETSDDKDMPKDLLSFSPEKKKKKEQSPKPEKKNRGPPSLPPKNKPPSLPPARPSPAPPVKSPPPPKPAKLKDATKRKIMRRASSVASVSSVDLENTLSGMLDLRTLSMKSQELSEILDLDKLYAKGPGESSSKATKNADDGHSKILNPKISSLRRGESTDSDTSRRSTVQSVDLADIGDLDTPLELPTTWVECNALVSQLKASYKKAKHDYYKEKTNEDLKKRAIASKAKVQAAEKHLATLPKPDVTKDTTSNSSQPRSKWRARRKTSKTPSGLSGRSTAVPWARRK